MKRSVMRPKLNLHNSDLVVVLFDKERCLHHQLTLAVALLFIRAIGTVDVVESSRIVENASAEVGVG